VRFRCALDVHLKPGLLDPQGKAVEASLPALGWSNVSNVRVGKHIELDVEADDAPAATAEVRDMAERLLSNPVIESYAVRDVRVVDAAVDGDRR
jgi:phosphoribosylformylglycinamidine synthase PurS subunit